MPVDLGRSVLTDDVTMREKVAASNLSVYSDRCFGAYLRQHQRVQGEGRKVVPLT